MRILAIDPGTTESAWVIEFVVPIAPVGQPRPRATVRNGHASVYDQKRVKNKTTGESKAHPIVAFKNAVRAAAKSAYGGDPLSGPVLVAVEFVFPRPQGMVWKKRPMPRVRHIKRPDRDNCEKALLDAMKGLVFVDDSQVCGGEVTKWIAAGDEQPHVLVSVWRLEE